MPLFNLLIVLLFTCGILIVKSMPIDEDLNSFVPERAESNDIADQSSEVIDNDSPPDDPKPSEENNNSDEQDYPYVYDIGGEEPLGYPVDQIGAPSDSIENTIEDYSLVDLKPEAPANIPGGVESLPNSNDETPKGETVDQSGSVDVNVHQSGSADVVVDADATPPETPKDEDSSFFGSIADLFSSDDESSADTDEDRISDDDLDIVPRKSDDSDIETDLSTDIETESEPFDVDQSDFEDSLVEEPETNQPNLEDVDVDSSGDDDEVVTEEEGSISKSSEEMKEEEMIEEDLEDDANDDVFVNDEQEESNSHSKDEPKDSVDLVVDDARGDDGNDEAKDSDDQINDVPKDNDDWPTEEVKTDEEEDEFDKEIEIDEIIIELENDELLDFDNNDAGDDSDDDSDFETKSKRGIEVRPDSEVSTQKDLSKGTGAHDSEKTHIEDIRHEDTAVPTHGVESEHDHDDDEHSKVHLTHSSDHHDPSPEASHHEQRKDHVNEIQTLSDQVPQFDIFVKPPYADPPITDTSTVTKRNILPIRNLPRPPPATPPLPLPLVPLQNALNKIPKPENILKLLTGLLPIPGATPLNIPG